jgi:hypothetical protein
MAQAEAGGKRSGGTVTAGLEEHVQELKALPSCGAGNVT